MVLLEQAAGVKGYRHTFSRAALETNCSVIFTLFIHMVSVKSSVTCSACALVSPTFSKRLICVKSQHVTKKTLLGMPEIRRMARASMASVASFHLRRNTYQVQSIQEERLCDRCHTFCI